MYFIYAYILLIILLALYSWIGSVYGWADMQNLLSADGLRWAVSSVLPNFQTAPIATVLMGVMTLGVVAESGVTATLRRGTTLKQRRALLLALCALGACVALLLVLTLLPNAVLLSSLGTFRHSPLSFGAYPLVLLVLLVVCITYGYASGRFLAPIDAVHAATNLLARCAPYFIAMFFAAQFIACLQYVFSTSAWLTDSPLLTVLCIVCYGIPLLFQLRNM